MDKIDTFLLTPVRYKISGVASVAIWCSSGEYEKGKRQVPRLFVGFGRAPSPTCTLTIAQRPQILAGELEAELLTRVQAWIVINQVALLKHWHGKYDSADLIDRLKRLPQDLPQNRRGPKVDSYLLDSLVPGDTGVAGCIIWVSSGEYEKDVIAGPRLFVTLGEEISVSRRSNATVSICKTPVLIKGRVSAALLAQIRKFILLNRILLLKFWLGEVSSKYLMNSIRKISGQPAPRCIRLP